MKLLFKCQMCKLTYEELFDKDLLLKWYICQKFIAKIQFSSYSSVLLSNLLFSEEFESVFLQETFE